MWTSVGSSNNRVPSPGELPTEILPQFSLLVTVVVLSAVVPTAIAARSFMPDRAHERHEGSVAMPRSRPRNTCSA